jgi:hypothetical protein
VCATANDWAGSTGRKQPRMSTCPRSGEPLLNLRDTPVSWQTLKRELSSKSTLPWHTARVCSGIGRRPALLS